MTFFLTYDVHFFSVFLLTLLLLTMYIKGDMYSTSGKIFRIIVLINIYMLILEVVSWQFNHRTGEFNWYANYISNMLFAWSGPLITCIWVSYIDYHMYESFDRIKKKFFFLSPMIVITVLIIINLFVPFIFSVDVNNFYSREPYMWSLVIVNSLIVVSKWIDAYKNRELINKEIVIAMLLYVIVPAIGAGLQVLVYGAFILWPLMSITIVVTYFYLDTISTCKDYLTKLLTRQRVEGAAKHFISIKRHFALVLIDLNDFKSINDKYGHVIGDQALKIFSKELMFVFKNSIVGRYGGDEFILIIPIKQMANLNSRISEIRSNLDLKYDLVYKHKFSYGIEIWEPSTGLSYKELLNEADSKMYLSKQQKS